MTDLSESGFFPLDDRDLGEPTITQPGHDSLGRCRRESTTGRIDVPPSFATQVKELVWRDMKYIKRDRTATAARVAQAALLAVFIGFIFFDIGQTTTLKMSNLQSRFGAIVLVSVISMMGPAQSALLAFPEERPVFLREYTTKHYSVTAYFLSRLLVEAIFGGIETLAIISISFFMIDFKGTFSIYLGATYLLAMGSTAIAVGVGAAAGANVKIATLFLPMILLPQIIFIGYLVVPDLIPVWFRWVNYLCPMTYATRIILIDEFYKCSEDPFASLGCDLLLLSVKANRDDVWWYWLILVAQFVVFRVIALGILQQSAKKFY
jgi:hypothetical protein